VILAWEAVILVVEEGLQVEILVVVACSMYFHMGICSCVCIYMRSGKLIYICMYEEWQFPVDVVVVAMMQQ